MSVHDYLFRKSGVPVINSHFDVDEYITYCPPGDRGSIELRLGRGNKEYLDEQLTGSEYKLERLRIRIDASQLLEHGITQVQDNATVEVLGDHWDVISGESHFGEFYVQLQLVRNTMTRMRPMRLP